MRYIERFILLAAYIMYSVKLVINDSVKNESLENLGYKYLSWTDQSRGFFLEEAGREHYKLLSCISKQLPNNSKVFDIGTYRGCSALSLTTNETVKVISYDIEVHMPYQTTTARNHPQVECRIADCLTEPYLSEMLESLFIFFDISPHNGSDEANFVKVLKDKNFQGVLVLDDIFLNDEMKHFWEHEIPTGIKKVDLSKYGHWSGTGALVFNQSVCDIELV